jgi:phosphoserine phosphatase RsbU/P
MNATQFAGIWIGVTLISIAAFVIFVWALRSRRDSLVLLSFSVWCTLYGLRLLALQPIVRTTLGGDPRLWLYVLNCLTYVVIVPAMLFFVGVLGAGWRRTMWWVVAVDAVYAVGAIIVDVVSGRPGAAAAPQDPIVLGSIAIGAVNLVHRQRGGHGEKTVLTEPIVLGGFVVMLLFVVNQNLGPVIVPGTNLEPIGILLFILCLGQAVVRSAIRNQANLLSVQRELETARRIQSSLLPRRMPLVAGVDLAVRYIPMTAVAGDFYDFVQVGPSAVGVLVADVSGHGIPAALVASMVKVAFQAQTERASDPAAVLSAMNEVLCRHLEHAYVTAVYAVIDTARRSITVTTAGHPPPLLQRLGGSAQRIDNARGMILGVLPGAEYTNTCIEGLGDGDRLLLYTDGVSEARNRLGEFFDEARTAQWLSGIARSSAEAFADAALADLVRWTGTDGFEDDVTFVLAQATSLR